MKGTSSRARLSFLALLLCLNLGPFVPSGGSTRPPAPLGRLIDLGGYKLHLACTGTGSPTVVLSAGAGDFSFDWALVQPVVARTTRVCSYDRNAEAWSDLGPKPRTAHQEVYDLNRLLTTAGEHPPYILVGQSLGGMIARLFAQQYPGETQGLVLVDSFHEDTQLSLNGKLVRVRTLAKDRPIPAPRQSINASDRLTDDEIKKIEDFISRVIGRPKIDPPFDRLPPEAQQDRLWALSQPKHYAEGDSYLAEEAARLYEEDSKTEHPLGQIPLIVLTRSRDDYPAAVAEVLSKEHKEQQASLARLSSAGKQIVVPNSGHHIQLDAPDAVVTAIRDVLNASRSAKR